MYSSSFRTWVILSPILHPRLPKALLHSKYLRTKIWMWWHHSREHRRPLWGLWYSRDQKLSFNFQFFDATQGLLCFIDLLILNKKHALCTFLSICFFLAYFNSKLLQNNFLQFNWIPNCRQKNSLKWTTSKCLINKDYHLPLSTPIKSKLKNLNERI